MPAVAETAEHVLWGIMDWKIDAGAPDTDTAVTRPVYRDSGARMVAHQYQGPHWLAAKVAETNRNEISRIYGAGHCINLMLYFVSCDYDEQTGEFSYPLNDQFLTHYAQLVDAYKVGGGPLYIQVFPEFEIWYENKSAAVQDAYRAKIVSQYQKMVAITRTNYSNAYIGLCFFSRDFTGNTAQFYSRWDPVISISDVVWVNAMTTFRQWNMHAEEYIKSTRLLSTNWGLPIIFPFVELWADKNTPVFGQTAGYSQDAQFFSNCITNWIGRVFTAPAETTIGPGTNWTTNLKTLKSRNLFAFSLYGALFNKPVTPPDPNGATHPLESYTVLTNLMRGAARSFLYPINEAEYWQNASNAPAGSAPWAVAEDSHCSSGGFVTLTATAPGQRIVFRAPVTRSGAHRVLVGVRKQSDGGRIRVYVDGSPIPQGPDRDGSSESGAHGYEEFDQGLAVFNNVNRTHWAQFTFEVTGAGAGGGHSLAIDYIKLIPQSPPLIPQSPTGLQVSSVGADKVLVTWNAVAGAETYTVKRSTAIGGPYTVVAAELGANSFIDSGVSANSTYYYVVTAANSAGEGAASPPAAGTPGMIIVDNSDAEGVEITGVWTASASSPGFHGQGYLHDGNSGGAGGRSVRFTPSLRVGGRYQVYLRWTSDANRASNVPVDVAHAGGVNTLHVNQRLNGGAWLLAGSFRFNAGTSGYVRIRNEGTDGFVIADAVRFVQLPTPVPRLEAQLMNGEFHVLFPTQIGFIYHVEVADAAGSEVWIRQQTIHGTGAATGVVQPLGGEPRFYRVQVE